MCNEVNFTLMRLYPQQMYIKGKGVCKTQGTHLKIHVLHLVQPPSLLSLTRCSLPHKNASFSRVTQWKLKQLYLSIGSGREALSVASLSRDRYCSTNRTPIAATQTIQTHTTETDPNSTIKPIGYEHIIKLTNCIPPCTVYSIIWLQWNEIVFQSFLLVEFVAWMTKPHFYAFLPRSVWY
jgi:hypothetical protein